MIKGFVLLFVGVALTAVSRALDDRLPTFDQLRRRPSTPRERQQLALSGVLWTAAIVTVLWGLAAMAAAIFT